MRVLFNATAALHGTSGAVHTVGLVSQLALVAPRHEIIVLSTREQTFLRDRLPGVGHHVANDIRGGSLARTARLQMRLGRIARAVDAGVTYNKGNFFAPLAGPQVCFIENSNPFSVLKLGEPLWYRTRNRLLLAMSRQALKHARAVVFPTEHARRLIAMRADVRSRAFVIPYGWELPEPEVIEPPEHPYVLCVSSILPYRNLTVVIEALWRLRQERRFDGDLLIVGVSGVSGGGYYHDVVLRRIRELGLVERVRLLPPVGPGRLAALYGAAACLVMPSLEETFGIPVIEAMGLGTPVVAARVDGAERDRYFIPFEEICADAAEYFNPFDAAACADAIERTTVAGRRAELAARGRSRARLYSWRAAAERTATVFDELS